MDPEAPIRAALSNKLEEFFHATEEVKLLSRSRKRIRCDLLLVPREQVVNNICLAIEIKSNKPLQPKNYRDTFFQAYSYVGARIVDGRFSDKDIDIKYAIVCQNRHKHICSLRAPAKITEEVIHSFQMDGVELAFNSFNVGYLTEDERGLQFKFDSNPLWSSKRGWHAECFRREQSLS